MDKELKEKIHQLATSYSSDTPYKGSIVDDRMRDLKIRCFEAGADAMYSLFSRAANVAVGVMAYKSSNPEYQEKVDRIMDELAEETNQGPADERSVATEPQSEKKTPASKRKNK